MMQRQSTPTLGDEVKTAANECSPATKNRHSGTECEVCGNEYDKPLELVVNGISHYFDCFECAIHALAPKCNHCGVRIVGHGVEAAGMFFCCAHCADEQGIPAMVDRA